jgi:RNA polymerase sigma-70 factor (ECF subfamily)
MRFSSGDASARASSADAELVLAARGGSREAKEGLYRKYVRQVFGLAFRLAGRFADPHEITRETLAHMLGALHEVAHPEVFRAWLSGVAVKVTHRAIRKPHAYARYHLMRAAASRFDDVLAANLPARDAMAFAHVYRSVDKLPLVLRTVYLLRHVEQMNLPDIAVALETSTGNVRRQLVRAEARIGIPEEPAA